MKGSALVFAIMTSSNKKEYSITELIQLCSLFDITESHLRTILSRMASSGLLVARREGKNAYYKFAEKGIVLKQNVALSFQSLDWDDWDKKWWGVSFSVPDVEKKARHYIRKKLTAYRFVSLNPGFWVRPKNKADQLEHHLQSIISNKHCCMIQFDFFNELSKGTASALWNLKALNKDFEDGLELIRESREKIRHLSPAAAFKEKIITGDNVVNILFKDPMLPELFLPDHWAAGALKRAFALWNKEITEISNVYLNTIECGGIKNECD